MKLIQNMRDNLAKIPWDLDVDIQSNAPTLNYVAAFPGFTIRLTSDSCTIYDIDEGTFATITDMSVILLYTEVAAHINNLIKLASDRVFDEFNQLLNTMIECRNANI